MGLKRKQEHVIAVNRNHADWLSLR